ncbi:hypothetical protein AEB_P3237 [Altererythrobacter sp. B11]|nr:hypothetical protein AEB_P3237 [Altererythrobacter sp. B11]
MEAGEIGGVHRPGDVQHGVGTLHEIGQRNAIEQIAAHPGYALPRGLIAPGKRLHAQPPPRGFFHYRLPDKAGAAGQGNDRPFAHSSTS